VKGRLLKSTVQGPAKDPNIDGRGALNAAAAVSLNQVNFSQSGVVRSKGDGPLADDRGHVSMRLQAWAMTPSPATSCNPNVATLISGETAANNRALVRSEVLNPDWSSSSWYSSSWYSSSWYSSSWYSSGWSSSSWYSSSWYAASWS
jgi:hypothetical protein